MIFCCWDFSAKALIYKYNEPNDGHYCKHIFDFNFIENGFPCGPDRFFISKYHKESNLIFAFCFDNIKVRKQATFFAKHAINMYLISNPVVESKQIQYEQLIKTSIHNTKNLNSQITSKILNHLNEKALSIAPDKVSYISGLIKNDPYLYAKVIISVLKLSSQITSEYNVIDYLKPNIAIPKTEFSYGKIHSLLVLAFYHFDYDFSQNNIHVNIHDTYDSAYFNFNTIQTALIHVFGNALRYCKSNSSIQIETRIYNDEYIDINFKMCSLYLTDRICKEGFVFGERSSQAETMYPKGTGLGLGIIKKLTQLNRGNFMFQRENDKIVNEKGYDYGQNVFTIRLLRNEFFD